MTRVRRVATRLRWPLALVGWVLWWLLAPPTSTGEALIGFTVLVVGHRLLAPLGVRARRRATLRARVSLLTVIGFLYGTAAPQAFAAAPDWGIPSNEDYCKYAPSPETSGSGITGILDPQSGIRLDGTIYGDRGYAGMFWFAYDPGCASASGDYLLGPLGGVAFDSNGAPSDTAAGNLLLSGAKIGLAAATGMRARALDPNFFVGLDSILSVGVKALRDLFITPWLGLPVMLLGLILLVLARRGDHAESAQRAGVGLAALAIISFLGQYPLQAAQRLDRQIVDFEQSMELGFIAKLPDSITPITQGCVFDFEQFSRPPTWSLTGEQIVSAVYCTERTRPTLAESSTGYNGYYYDPDGLLMHYDLDYFRNHYVPEVLVAELIFPYWQEGLLGTTDRSGPNYELARSFLLGQSLAEYDIAMQNYRAGSAAQSPVGSVWCTYRENTRVCGRSETGGVPGQLMTATEERYRASIEAAGPDRYPYIQGRAANRTAAAAKSLAAVAAAAPPLFAAYTGVFAGRLLLRIFVFAGLIMALALFLFPKLLRRMLGTVGSALATILMLAAMGALMTFLTLQLVANPAVFGSIGPTGGMIILAVISVLTWLAVKPMRRIGAMLSTAAFNNPQALSDTRRKVTGFARGGVNRILRRRPVTGRDLDRLSPSNDPSYPAALPAEPSRPRPEGLAVAPARPVLADRPVRAVDETPARARSQRTVIHPTVKPHRRTAESATARTNAAADIYRPSLTTPSRRQLAYNPAAQVPAELIWSPPPPPVPAAAATPRDPVPVGGSR